MMWTNPPPPSVVITPAATRSRNTAEFSPCTQDVRQLPSRDVTRLDGEWTGRVRIGSLSFWQSFVIEGSTVARRTMLDPTPRVGRLIRSGNNLRFETASVSIDAAINATGDTLTGKMTQAGAPSVSLRLVRHPQTPVPPFPYRVENVVFRSQDATTIAGTLTMPFGNGPFPGLVLISGSQPADRDYVALGAIPAHRPFAVLADTFARDGIATLRFDDRGVGGSQGRVLDTTADQRLWDVQAALEELARRPEMDSRRIGLLGHSAGALLAGRLAAKASDIAFVILLNAPGTPAVDYAGTQAIAVARNMGLDQAGQSIRKDEIERVDQSVIFAHDTSEALTHARDTLRAMHPTAGPGQTLSDLNTAVQASSPFYRFMLAYDPIPDLEKIKKPLLVIEGDKDSMINGTYSAARIEHVLSSNHSAHVCLRPTMDHTMRDEPVPGDENDLMETISPSLSSTIARWVVGLKK